MMSKKKPIRLLSLYFILLVLGTNHLLLAQTGEISGIITMPALQKETRMFRGNLYRNRLATTQKTTRTSDLLRSAFIDIIIIAHPQNFKPVIQPLADAKILQKAANFVPRVLPVTLGTVVQIINRDKFFHNVFSITPGAEFNIGRRPTNIVIGHKINKLGEIKLFCDIHAQMNATILSLDTPYFVRVEQNGKYRLSGLPAGTYKIIVYHPDFTSINEVISLKADEKINKDFTLSR